MVCTYQNPQDLMLWVVTEASWRPKGPRRNEDCMANIQSPSPKGRTFRTNIRTRQSRGQRKGQKNSYMSPGLGELCPLRAQVHLITVI